jgi:hypothetical protein
VRLGAVLLSLHVAVGPSKIRRVGGIVLLAKLGGATGPYLSLVQAKSSQVKNCSPGYMEQSPSRGHDASLQSGLGVG